MNELVSIVVPVYNVEDYLDKCLFSLIHQTYHNIEIIVIIDGSTDKSIKIAKKYARRDSRIKILNRENKGVLYSRIEGVHYSKGNYITFVDGDDALQLNAIEIMLEAIILEQSDLVKANYVKQTKDKIIQNKVYVTKKTTFQKENYEPTIYHFLYQDIYFNSMCFCMMKKELFQNISFQYDLVYGEDLTSMLDIILHSNKITIIPEYVYIYTINQKGITLTKEKTKIKKKMDDVQEVYNNLAHYVDVYSIKNKEYYYELANTKLILYLTIQFLELSSVSQDFKNNFQYLCKKLETIDCKKVNKEYLKNYHLIYRLSIRSIKNPIILYFISIVYKYFK